MDMISWVQCTSKSCESGVEGEEKGWLVVEKETMIKAENDDHWKCPKCSELSNRKTSLLTRYQAFQEKMNKYKEANASKKEDERVIKEFTPEFFDQSSAAWMQNKVRILDENGFTVGYRYKNPKEMRLWQPPKTRKKRRRFKCK